MGAWGEPMRRTLLSLTAVAAFCIAGCAALSTESGKTAAASGNVAQADLARLPSLLVTQTVRCWNPPAGVSDSSLVVTVRFALNKDGTLSGEPAVIGSGDGSLLFKAAAASALRAVRACQPFRLPAAQYDIWKDVEMRFDPQLVAPPSPH
jgi:colicin import membrane protein